MGTVVQFLAVLMSEAENGGVRRMLGVCSEFERIATVVLDKAEREHASRRKRKSADEAKAHNLNTSAHRPSAKPGSSIPLPHMSPSNGMSPPVFGVNSSPGSASWQTTNEAGMSGRGVSAEYLTPPAHAAGYSESQSYTNGSVGAPEMNSPMSMSGNNNTFARPFVPQDLWQMPMSLEWDWADMTGGQYPSFENGLVSDPMLYSRDNNAHLMQG